MSKATESVDLPTEGFALLIRSAAQAIINHINLPAKEVQPAFLHEQVGTLDTLVSKFENLHHKEQP